MSRPLGTPGARPSSLRLDATGCSRGVSAPAAGPGVHTWQAFRRAERSFRTAHSVRSSPPPSETRLRKQQRDGRRPHTYSSTAQGAWPSAGPPTPPPGTQPPGDGDLARPSLPHRSARNGTPRRKQKSQTSRKRVASTGSGCPRSLPVPAPAGRAPPTARWAHALPARRRAPGPGGPLATELPAGSPSHPPRWPTYRPHEEQGREQKTALGQRKGTKGTEEHAHGTGNSKNGPSQGRTSSWKLTTFCPSGLSPK